MSVEEEELATAAVLWWLLAAWTAREEQQWSSRWWLVVGEVRPAMGYAEGTWLKAATAADLQWDVRKTSVPCLHDRATRTLRPRSSCPVSATINLTRE
ncbi:hypothetical protein SESBI_18102 [Sesbania bispinosa]|nr:hypothetical protein SESBI_18102 [Sesbania bispinosa]